MQRLKLRLALFALRNRQLLVLAACGLFLCMAGPSHAHAAIDFTDITNQWASIKGFAIFAASAIAAVMMVMTVIKLVGRDWGEAIMYASGAALSGYVAAHAAGWISAETGASL